jgi:hypothetical protein
LRPAWLLPSPPVNACKVLEEETLGLDFQVMAGKKNKGPAVGLTFILYEYILSGLSRISGVIESWTNTRSKPFCRLRLTDPKTCRLVRKPHENGFGDAPI